MLHDNEPCWVRRARDDAPFLAAARAGIDSAGFLHSKQWLFGRGWFILISQ